MATSYQVTFDILGNLDPSLLAAIKNAQKSINSLGKLNGKTLANARALQQLRPQLKAIQDYRALQRAILDTQKLRANELLNASRYNAAQAQASKRLNDLRGAYQTLNNEFKARKKSLDAAQIADYKQRLQLARDEIKAQRQLVNDWGKAGDKSSAQADKLRAQLATQQAQLAQMRQGLPAGSLAGHEAQLRAQIQATTNALNAQIAALAQRNQVMGQYHQARQDLSTAYSDFQNALSTAQGIINPFTQAADNAMTFEAAMSKVKALTQMRNLKAGSVEAVEASMKALSAQAKELGATTEFTATEIADAMGYLGMAGWDASKIQPAMKSLVDLASIAGDHNIPRTADVFSDVMTALNLMPGQMMKVGNNMVETTSHFGDAMAYALTQSNMNRESFFEALKYSAPIAATAGLTIGEEIAANMLVASSGLKGSMAGTGMRSGLLTLAGANKKAQAALEEVGMTSSDAQRQMAEAQNTFESLGVTGSNFSQRIMQLGEAFSQMTGDEQILNAYKIFGKNAATFWTKLLSNGDALKQFAQYAREIDEGYVTGWGAQTAAVMRDNTKTELEYVKSAWDAIENAAGSALLPTIRNAAQAISPLMTRFSEWVALNPQVVQGAAAIAASLATASVAVTGFSLAMAGIRFAQAGFGTAKLLLGSVTSSVLNATNALRGLNVASAISGSLSSLGAALSTVGRAAFALAFSPIGAALMAIGLAGYYAYTHWSQVSNALSTLGAAFSSSLGPALDNALTALNELASVLSSSFDGVAFESLSALVSSLASAIGGGLVGAFIVLAGVAGSVLTGIVTGVAGLVKTVAELGSGIVEALSAITSGDLSAGFEKLANTGAQAASNFKAAWSNSFEAVTKGLSGTGQAFETFIKQASSAPDTSTPQPISQPITQPITQSITQPIQPIQAIPQPTTQPEIQVPTIDVQPIQESLNQIPAAIMPVQESLSQLPSALLPAQESLSQLPAALLPAQESLSQLPAALLPAQESLSQLPAALLPVQESLNQLPSALSPVQEGFGQLTAEAQNLSAGLAADNAAVAAHGAALTGNIGALQAFGGACQGAVGSTNALGGAASQAAGAVSGLGAAAQAACSQLAAAGANAAAQVSAAAAQVSTTPAQTNYKGGIYPKGAFLTTFAERSPEAAIPLDDSSRAKDLWTRAGQILGLLPGTATYDQSPDIPPEMMTQTQPRYYKVDNRRGLSVPRLISAPLQTPGQFPMQWTMPPLFDDAGISPVKERSTMPPPINLTINVTVNGPADKVQVQRGVEAALPTLERTFEEQWYQFNHERMRRAFQ